MSDNKVLSPSFVFFDFGGVIAEEGFKKAMEDLALNYDEDPASFKAKGFQLVYDLGFTRGEVREDSFWQAFRKATGVREDDLFLTDFVKERFVLRPFMLDIVLRLKEEKIGRAILSDQTHWLSEIDRLNPFFHHFDRVFNSYDLAMTKKEPRLFSHVLDKMGVLAEDALFIDDHLPHIERAKALGMDVIWYRDKEDFLEKIYSRFPFLSSP